MVLLAWESVPLITATVIPGCDRLTVPDQWQFDTSMVTLEQYVSAKSRQIREASEKSQTRQEYFRQIEILLAAGKIDQASELLDSLDGNDSVVNELRQGIGVAAERASAQMYLSAADQADKAGKPARAFDLLHEALSFADESLRGQVVSRLIRIEGQLDKLNQDTASARKFLFAQLGEMSIDEINLQIDQVASSVADLIKADQDQWLVRAGKSISEVIRRSDLAIEIRLAEMEAMFLSQDQKLSQLLEKRALLHENLALIKTTLESAKPKNRQYAAGYDPLAY